MGGIHVGRGCVYAKGGGICTNKGGIFVQRDFYRLWIILHPRTGRWCQDTGLKCSNGPYVLKMSILTTLFEGQNKGLPYLHIGVGDSNQGLYDIE